MVKDKGVGQYDLEYKSCSCFWGEAPGKYVYELEKHLSDGKILDLGAGEGKNAIYLATKGFEVHTVECSEYAIRNFKERLNAQSLNVVERVKVFAEDATNFEIIGKYDAVIAYGFLHCLANKTKCDEMVAKMKEVTVAGGYNVIVTFTNELPIPAVQDYLEATLLSYAYLKDKYHDWKILKSEEAIITETHPTSNVKHQHSLCRILARRPGRING